MIPLYQPNSETNIKKSLNSTIPVFKILSNALNKANYEFVENKKIENYQFDFYFPNLNTAIIIDGYAHEFSEIYNKDLQKKLFIHSLNITVFKFTDHLISTNIDEIIKILKKHETKL